MKNKYPKEEKLPAINDLADIVSRSYHPVISGRLNRTAALAAALKKRTETLLKDLEALNHKNDPALLTKQARLHHQKVIDLLNDYFTSKERIYFNDEFKDALVELEKLAEDFEDVRRRKQDKNRFTLLRTDNFSIRIFKRIKKIFYKISQFPVVIINAIRELLRKEKKPPRDWHHSVPLKNLILFYFRDELFISLLNLIRQAEKKCCDFMNSFWKIEERVQHYFEKKETESLINSLRTDINEFDKLINEISKVEKELFEAEMKILPEVHERFIDAYEKAGTIELPTGKLSRKKLSSKEKSGNSLYEKSLSGWNNTKFVLLEDWRLNKELYAAYAGITEEYLRLSGACEKRTGAEILPKIDAINSLINQLQNKIESAGNDISDMILLEKESFHNSLTGRLIPAASDSINENDFADVTDNFENRLKDILNNVSKKRALIKSEDYSREVRDSEISYFSPNELISFDILPQFLNTIKNIKSRIIIETDSVQQELITIDQIADFGLESAIAASGRDTDEGESVRTIALQSLHRAAARTDEIKSKFDNIVNLIRSDLKDAVEDVNTKLTGLTDNETLFSIKLRIAKAVAIQQTKKVKADIWKGLKNLLPAAAGIFRNVGQKLVQFYRNIKSRFGLETRQIKITAELSDFLAETQKAIEKLPFVYQRLFHVKPLTSERFFEGREFEMKKMEAAFNSWQAGRFAPVAVVSEKGGGATSLVNLFFLRNNFRLKKIHVETPDLVFTEDGYLKIFQNMFPGNKFSSHGEVISYLNNLDEKMIIVLENLQHLYLRKVNGFICLNMLAELISLTNSKIFWVTSSTLYSWEYLRKTIRIDDYFGYVIRLQPLIDDRIIDIILKRHNVSGYNIKFEPSKGDVNNKVYKKLNEKDKQEFLKKNYFSKLNKFAKSNLSLALLYWLRSTQAVSNNTIVITTEVDFDFSFLGGLASEKIFLLSALLLHDGLSVGAISLIFNQTEEKIRLSLISMIDDGLVILKNNLYFINPLLYRHTVSMLQSKNIIH